MYERDIFVLAAIVIRLQQQHSCSDRTSNKQ